MEMSKRVLIGVGLTVVLLAPSVCYAQLDFGAIARGRRQAEDQNYQDMQRAEELRRMREARAYGERYAPAQPLLDNTQWESAYYQSGWATGDSSIMRCEYQTYGGYKFAINSRGSCQSTVEIDPVSGRVKIL